MIPIHLFEILVVAEVVLVLYSFIDVRNKYYANIATAFIASLLAIFLAVVISVGGVQYDPPETLITLVNGTSTEWYCVNESFELFPVSDPGVCVDLQYKSFAVNTTISIPQCWNCEATPIIDLPVGFILMIFAILMMIYSALMIYDAYLEWKMSKQEDEGL